MVTTLTYPTNKTPEYLAVAGLLDRRERMQKLSVDLLRQEKITQKFLRHFMEEMINVWFDLEEKTDLALRLANYQKQETREALIKADNAVRTTEIVIEMGKLLNLSV